VLEGFSSKLRGLLRKGGTHRPIEDLMTSTILGSLAYMPPEWASKALRAILGSRVPLPEGIPSAIDVKLWPSERADSRRVEPDAVIKLEKNASASEERTFLIEAKWKHKITKEQLQNQRKAVKHNHHILLVPHEAQTSSRSHVDDGGQVIIITWYAVASGLITLARNEGTASPLGRWAQAAADFLAEMGERPFAGFRQTKWQYLCPPEAPLFYCECFDWPACSFTVPAKATLFFTTIRGSEK